MKHLLIILLLGIFAPGLLLAQERLTKYPVGNSGCSAYFISPPGAAELSYSPDSSRVYTMTASEKSGITYDLITVALSQEMPEEGQEQILISYLDYLKEQMKIVHSAGYGHGHSLTTHPSARGVLDYWSDSESEIAVMGYIDGKFIAVLMVSSNNKAEGIENKREAFFKGFRFPGD